MPRATEHGSVQSRILRYASEIGWAFISRAEAETLRGFSKEGATASERSRDASLFFDDLLYTKVCELNPRFRESKEELVRRLSTLKPNIFGNQDFVHFLRAEKTFFDADDGRELDLVLIDYDDDRTRNIYQVTEEFYYHNGKYGVREDVVFLINGIPVLTIECKNANKDEAIALGIDQIRRYHTEAPELMIPQQIFAATESIGFSYGVTWSLIRRNIFNWREKEIGNLENKIKTFCTKEHILAYLKDYILFVEKDEVLTKLILRQHQTQAVRRVIERAHDPVKHRALIWHTQGSGKTYTMIKSAEMLFKAPQSEKPTVLLMIDRNELEDQMVKNLASLGLGEIEQAYRISDLQRLLAKDYRGIIVTMIHKFRDMPPNVNLRKNIYVLIDEAHRSTGGDLGTFMLSALPNATFIGFTGTPIDKTAYGKGTFKTFGIDDKDGYLHKYSISDSIDDKTTLPLFYAVAPNELLVPKEVLEKEFLHAAEEHGITDIEELNALLDRCVTTKNFLKSRKRITKVTAFVAKHFKETVEPMGYKAFLVGVDREACALYKNELDKLLPSEYSEVVYTGNNNDSELLKAFHHQSLVEKDIRKRFTKYEELPKILIVTEKLLTGFDAPLLYAMYLDKPMRDHALLQAIARVNRPYEDEARGMVKPHGFVLDFVGIFDDLEKALAFDSDEVASVIHDIKLLKSLFARKMEQKATEYLSIIGTADLTDKDNDNLIEYFRDKERRKEFFKEFKEIEMLYEIISPDPFLRPYLDDYKTLSYIFAVVRRAYAKRRDVDREFQRKTEEFIRQNVDADGVNFSGDLFEINSETIEKIKKLKAGDNVKVINLIKSIEKVAEESSGDPSLISLGERAEAVKENFENRQRTTQEALDELFGLIARDAERKKEQARQGFDSLSFFVFSTLQEKGLPDAEQVTGKIGEAFAENPHWLSNIKEYRDLRRRVTIALSGVEDDLDKVASIVEEIFTLLAKSYDSR
jgi:type I restriction enzyme R subunit